MITIMSEKRGYESALSACPAPAAAFAPVDPAQARPRTAASGFRLALAAVPPFQGTGLPVAGITTAQIDDVPTMLVQLHPGDTARRPPA